MSGARGRVQAGAALGLAIASLLGSSAVAEAQSGRVATLPPPPAAPGTPAQWPTRIRDDGSVIVELARGYEYVVRPCAYYVNLLRQHRQAQRRAVQVAPQGGSGQRPPGAAGLPQAPGLPALPGGPGRAATTGAGRAATGAEPARRSPAVPRVHSSGLPYHNGICHVRDAYGRLRLIPL